MRRSDTGTPENAARGSPLSQSEQGKPQALQPNPLSGSPGIVYGKHRRSYSAKR